MSEVKCDVCGHEAGYHNENPLKGCALCDCAAICCDILRAAHANSNDQIRKLQDSANKRLDEYREVTAFLREVLDRLEVEAYEGRPYPPGACGGCPTCDIFKRAEVMHLR